MNEKEKRDSKEELPFHKKYWWIPSVISMVATVVAVAALVMRLSML